jgi:hypothetical protein
MCFIVIVSCLATGKVKRRRFSSRRQAREWADRYAPAGKGKTGWRVEMAWGGRR